MKHYSLITLVVLVLQFNLHAQNSLEYAEQAEKAFPDADVVLLSSKVDVTFKASKKKGKLVANVEYNDIYLALENNTSSTFAIFYDEYSEMKKFDTGGQERDEFYNSNNIFHSDTRVKYSNMKLFKYGDMRSFLYTTDF